MGTRLGRDKVKNKQLKGVCKVGACKCDHLQEDVVNDEICPKRCFLSCDVKQMLACLSENAFSLSLHVVRSTQTLHWSVGR